MAEMTGKVALVAGGAGGIGSSVCQSLVNEGARVAVADMDSQRTEALADKLGGPQVALPVDVQVTSVESVAASVQQTLDAFGQVDCLVYCAGNNVKAPFLELTLEQWNSQLDTHLTGAYLCCQAVGRHMVQRGAGGRMVLLSSVAAWAPIPERGAYSPAKAGLVSLAQLLSIELARYRINVNAVCPGVAKTPMTEMVYARDPSLMRERRKRMPLGREVLPEEIADLVVFLCGERSTYITGTAIPIDGGFLNTHFMPEPAER